MPLPVSVQVCTLNEADNLEACLNSVLSNDPEEVLVIDGGSTDGTRDIAQRMGARVLNPGRLGLGPSRKLG
jgi:glycosyltransferase involved in cell wall biosynthesis